MGSLFEPCLFLLGLKARWSSKALFRAMVRRLNVHRRCRSSMRLARRRAIRRQRIESSSSMDDASRQAEYRFGRFRLLPIERELRVGNDAIPLGARAFDVLVVLVSAEGQLVPKDEIFRRVWPDLVVEDNNLQVQISSLRKILGY